MATLYVHHKVADYAQWRAVVDEVRGLRNQFGETGERVFQTASNPNEVAILVDFGNADQARAWAAAPELKEAMKRAGVLTQPDVLILDDAADAQALTRQVLKAIEDQDFEAARALLSDDFQFSGAVPNPISADEWLGVHKALAGGMPDFSFHYQATGGTAEEAQGTVQVGGTHTRTFVPPIPGVPPIPASGKQILNPVERVLVTARNGKLTRYVVESVPNGGLIGILTQMGAAIHAQ
jgi:hypothetical protein